MGNAPTSQPTCLHEQVSCLNQYELIRKYRCNACGGVMMCACNENFGRRFLVHQLTMGRELNTQTDVPVDLGFVPDTCPECRGLPPVSAPIAESFGRTSKIRRYYWRELFFRETLRQAEWADVHANSSLEEREAAFAAIEAEVLEEIKALHAASPRYTFSEPSQAEVLKRYNVEVQPVNATYGHQPAKGAVIRDGDDTVSPEIYVSHLYERQGWSVMPLESMPLHALFGVMMWVLIQDGSDPRVRMAGFGDRNVYEVRGKKAPVWTLLPDDFGGKGYATRRKEQIAGHFDIFPNNAKICSGCSIIGAR